MSALNHVDVDLGDRTEAPSLDQDGPLAKDLRRLQHFAGWPEHRGAAEAQLHELQAHHTIVDMAELDSRKLDHVDFDTLRGEVVEQRFEDQLRLVLKEKVGIEQIDSYDAQSLLLQVIFTIEHADMDNDLAVVVPRVSLKFYAHPAMALVSALIVASRDGIGEDEEGGALPAR